MCAETNNVVIDLIANSCRKGAHVCFDYSPFHSSLPFEHLGQSSLFTRDCRLFLNQLYPILELKQCPRCS